MCTISGILQTVEKFRTNSTAQSDKFCDHKPAFNFADDFVRFTHIPCLSLFSFFAIRFTP